LTSTVVVHSAQLDPELQGRVTAEVIAILGVGVGLAVGVAVGVGVLVGVGVEVAVGAGVFVGVGVDVGITVGVGHFLFGHTGLDAFILEVDKVFC